MPFKNGLDKACYMPSSGFLVVGLRNGVTFVLFN